MTHTLRPALFPDASSISRLVRRAYAKWIPLVGREPKPMTADYRRALADHEIWLLDGAGGLVGVIELIAGPGALMVENVAVDPVFQGLGLGRLLLAFAEDEARRHHLPEVQLYTDARFSGNLAFYERLGYHEIDRRPNEASELVFLAKRVEEGMSGK